MMMLPNTVLSTGSLIDEKYLTILKISNRSLTFGRQRGYGKARSSCLSRGVSLTAGNCETYNNKRAGILRKSARSHTTSRESEL